MIILLIINSTTCHGLPNIPFYTGIGFVPDQGNDQINPQIQSLMCLRVCFLGLLQVPISILVFSQEIIRTERIYYKRCNNFINGMTISDYLFSGTQCSFNVWFQILLFFISGNILVFGLFTCIGFLWGVLSSICWIFFATLQYISHSPDFFLLFLISFWI